MKYKIRLNADTGDFETMEIDIVVGDLTNYYYNIVEIMVGVEYTTVTGEVVGWIFRVIKEQEI